MILGITRFLWEFLVSSPWWLQTAARAESSWRLLPLYVLCSLGWEDQMARARTSGAHCSCLSHTLSLSFHLSGLSTWCPQQGSLQIVMFLKGQMKTPRVGVPREQGETCIPLFTPGLGVIQCYFYCTLSIEAITKPIQLQGFGNTDSISLREMCQRMYSPLKTILPLGMALG